MKFLCVSCDEQMQLVGNVTADPRGSLTVLFACPGCRREMALLTNPWETEVVASLGVRVGAGGTSAEAPAAATGCPLAVAAGEAVAAAQSPPAGKAGEGPIVWTAGAQARLERIPEFVRPLARRGIEQYARTQGWREIDERVLEEARQAFGM